MASTNKTTHYNLSQYVGTDKPTYLVDYNQDMSRIDAGIYGVDAKATINATNIGDLSELTTTDKLSLVNAINEVNSESSTVGDLSDLTTTSKTNVVSAINEVNGKANTIGDLTNLTTTDKSSVVGAVNEVNGKTATIGNLSSLTTTDKTSVVNAINEVDGNTTTNATAISGLNTRMTQAENDIDNFNLTSFNSIATNTMSLTNGGTISSAHMNVATNSDGSLAKIYGDINLSQVGGVGTVSFPTSLRPTETLTINGGCIRIINGNAFDLVSITINTNGTVSVPKTWATGTDNSCKFFFINSLLYIKEFGDTPIPEPNN